MNSQTLSVLESWEIPLCNLQDLYCETEGFFVQINRLIQIILTHPVTSNEGERSFIVLRRLYSWMRTSMTENRLTDLARMHIYPYRLSNVSDIRVIDIFSLNQPRRLETKRLHDFGRKYNFFFFSYQRIFFIFF